MGPARKSQAPYFLKVEKNLKKTIKKYGFFIDFCKQFCYNDLACKSAPFWGMKADTAAQ